MFGKTRVSQSMLDAVNSVIGEEPIVENKKAKSMLSEEGPAITPETLKGQILKKKDDKKASLGKPAIAMSAEEVELDEEGNCVTPMKAKKIADKEVGKHEKEMHKEDMTFKERLLEKSVSTKQARTMAAAAHNPKFAKKVGIPQDVAKDFNQADKGTKMLSKAMSEEEVLDEKDELRSRIGTNIVNKKPREGQTDLKNIPVGNRPDSKRTFSQGERDSQPSRLKNDIKASLGKHTKPNLPEESEMQESLKDVAKKILHKVGGGSDKDQLKKLQKNMGVPQTGEKPKNEEVVDEAAESPFTSYKDKTKPSIFAPKSHTPKKTSTGTVYTKNWSKKDMEHKADDKAKNEAVDKEADQHVRVDGETDMKTKTVDGLRGRMKVPADYHNKSKSYKVALTVGEETELSEENDSHTHAAHYEDPKTGEWNGMKLITAKDDEDAIKQAHSNCEDGCRLSKVERHKTIKKEAMEHPDEKEDKALVKKMVKKDALKKTDEAFKGPEAGSGTGDHPFVTAEAKPLKNARELAKKTMHRIKNEMLGKISN